MTFEEELERDKLDKIAEVAGRGGEIADELGEDPEAVEIFLHHYFRHVDARDVNERSIEDLLGLVESHYRLAMQRAASRAAILIRTPNQSADGWTAGSATVVQIVTDDRPFLVDSVSMEVLRQGWSIRELLHPQFWVRRDVGGTLHDVVQREEAQTDSDVSGESWMHLEILPPAGSEVAENLAPALEEGLREVLRLVEEAVQDWQRMMRRSEETVEMLSQPEVIDGHVEEAEEARELLEWLNDRHFTFLGYREYRLVGDGDRPAYQPVPSTGLGILRADRDQEGAFHALPQPGTEPWLMIITKDNYKSRVHRPAYLDYLGIRIFDDSGRVVGERRFLGLFSSTAYSESVTRVPVLKQKAEDLLAASGYSEQSHGGKAIMDVLDTYPRDELFQTSVDEIAPIVEKVAHLRERRQVRLFVRRDPYGRYLSCLVYLPRDRYTTAVRERMQAVLMHHLAGKSIDHTARVGESVLARLHFVVRMPVGESIVDPDVRSLEKELTLATRSWDDEFADQVFEGQDDVSRLSSLGRVLPEGYKEDYTAKQALKDLVALTGLSSKHEMSMAMYVPDKSMDEADLRLKIFRRDSSLSLSQVLPHLSSLGVDVIDERPYELELDTDSRAFIYDFGILVPGGTEAVAKVWPMEARQQFMDAFAASYQGFSEYDGFNALVMGAGLNWRQVGVLRAIGRYLRQGGSTFSQTYIASALSSNTEIATLLVELFENKFNPRLDVDLKERQSTTEDLVDQIKSALGDVASLDQDRIMRSYLAVIGAVIRTNAFQSDRQALVLKLLPRKIADLPEPRPAFEIYVYSPRVEGVHLRFGAVARGGLRWSDRAEDFRTEVLGLVKAQMVKNTVIVPVGAKGGFYCKRLPDPAVDRDAWQAEGVACYELFISSLLDVTDNIVDLEVVPPVDVVRYDKDDPYLVVAADKGTATFSDKANAISVTAGFWLGDAFASGGSAGYDHKAMGITARGAWESVKRHFREMGVNCQEEDFTCVGIGDMSGDVFGNGMLLSKHIGLVAAFDHRHILIDPHPGIAASWEERKRMFGLPRSTWADYDDSLISEGGGIFPRTLKSITISPQMREVLGIDQGVDALSPADLINACLKAPVDLLWNGGIGTYVKAASESNAEVGDKANDGLRINGAELRAQCVGEGGNLGLTQLGRIEYAASGGRIVTDFIDNSAGVDTSDHEVNIKILLATEVAAGRLSAEDRDTFLASMTDEVADLVLAHNYYQNLALANSEFQAYSLAGVHEDWMQRLEEAGQLDRAIEFLPSTADMENRREDKRGLTAPELATLMSYTKIILEAEALKSSLPDDPYLADRLVNYFPTAMRERYADEMSRHRLWREIITTVVVNQFVNSSGITAFHRISSETGAAPADVMRAQIAAKAIFGSDDIDRQIRALDHQISARTQTALRIEVRTLIERATRWLLNSRHRPIDIKAAVEQFQAGAQQVQTVLATILEGRELDAYQKRLATYREADVPEELASAVAVFPPVYAALTIVQTAVRENLSPEEVARVHFTLGQDLGLDRLLGRIIELPRDDRWQTMARAALRDDLHTVHAQLTNQVLSTNTADEAPAERVTQWRQSTDGVADAAKMLRSICEGRSDLARMSVGLRTVRGVVSSEL